MNTESQKQLALMLRRRAMDLLARREHTRQELQQKLLNRLQRDAAKKIEPFQDDSASAEHSENIFSVLERVLDQLETDKLLSDERFAESFVSARSHRGYGPLYIRHQLRQKKLDNTLMHSSLEAVDHDQWLQQLLALLSRKLGDAPLPVPPSKEFLRIQRFVLTRGFTPAQWREAQKRWQQHS